MIFNTSINKQFWLLYSINSSLNAINLNYLPLAIVFHSCEDISGIWRTGVENRVSLYTEDLLFFISSPVTSLPFHVDGNALTSEYTNLPVKIVENQFTFLGITVTRKHKCLFKENFFTLLNHVKQWSPLSTSLVDRIDSKWTFSLHSYIFFSPYQLSFLNPFLTH